uniref:Uncharacterized protein n=1 Tax=Candidatus Kentrum sp. LFY TaxID=2126342 RepID=A0A450WZA2_9GAMM|nr:MAG: hypothetical protein BECKLFY1418C_GA0070996_11171 [Candidatus Kentron sp. LFY]
MLIFSLAAIATFSLLLCCGPELAEKFFTRQHCQSLAERFAGKSFPKKRMSLLTKILLVFTSAELLLLTLVVIHAPYGHSVQYGVYLLQMITGTIFGGIVYLTYHELNRPAEKQQSSPWDRAAWGTAALLALIIGVVAPYVEVWPPRIESLKTDWFEVNFANKEAPSALLRALREAEWRVEAEMDPRLSPDWLAQLPLKDKKYYRVLGEIVSNRILQ